MNPSRSKRRLFAAALLLLVLGLLPGAMRNASALTPTTITLASSTAVKGPDNLPATVISPNSRYGTIAGASWITSPANTGSNDIYTITFTLPAAFYGAGLNGSFFADNWATVWLNSNQIAAQTAGDVHSNYGFDDIANTPTTLPTPFTAVTALVPGPNILVFKLSNFGGAPTGGNPEALAFKAIVSFLTVATDKDQCKKGGWETLVDSEGNSFKNQGDCVSYVATKGKNLGSIAPTTYRLLPAVGVCGGLYNNDQQMPAAWGQLTVTPAVGSATLAGTTTSLLPNTAYTVYIDSDGWSIPCESGPFETVGTFFTDAAGSGSFNLVHAATPGPHTWSVFINGGALGYTILVGDNMTFTVS